MNFTKCPLCDSKVDPTKETKHFPFCSKRCQLIDLKRWLGEEYSVPDDNPMQSEFAESDYSEDSQYE